MKSYNGRCRCLWGKRRPAHPSAGLACTPSQGTRPRRTCCCRSKRSPSQAVRTMKAIVTSCPPLLPFLAFFSSSGLHTMRHLELRYQTPGLHLGDIRLCPLCFAGVASLSGAATSHGDRRRAQKSAGCIAKNRCFGRSTAVTLWLRLTYRRLG